MFEIQKMDCSTFVAYRHDIFIREGRTTIGWAVSSYSLGGARRVVYLQDTTSIEGADATELLNGSLFAYRYACGDGRLFYSSRNAPDYCIECVDKTGDPIYSIRQDAEVVSKSAGEMERESQSVEDWLNGMGSSNVVEYVYNPRPWREPVRGMWVTVDGTRLWVLRGNLDGFRFDIYSTVEGRLLEAADVQLDTTGLWQIDFFVADSNRIHAILETRDFDQLLVRFRPAG